MGGIIICDIILCNVMWQRHRIDLVCGINVIIDGIIFSSKVVTNIIAGTIILDNILAGFCKGSQFNLSSCPSVVEKSKDSGAQSPQSGINIPAS